MNYHGSKTSKLIENEEEKKCNQNVIRVNSCVVLFGWKSPRSSLGILWFTCTDIESVKCYFLIKLSE